MKGRKVVFLMYKDTLCIAFGLIGAIISFCFGGWSLGLTTLIWFMLIDYAMGLILAGVFKKSKKSKSGKLSSSASWKGLCKKFISLVLVSLGYRVDLLTGQPFVRDAIIISFIVNELLSICENAGLMGIPIPKALTRAIEILKKEDENVQ